MRAAGIARSVTVVAAGAVALLASIQPVGATGAHSGPDTSYMRPWSAHAAHGHGGGGGGSKNLSYHGGVGGIGVESAPTVYLVLWGAQWNSNDPSGESSLLQGFFNHVGGSGWLN